MKKPLPLILAFLCGLACPYATEFGCERIIRSAMPYGEKEMSRTTSPDGVLDAVVIQRNPGAFSSFQYFLFLVRKGTSTKDAKTDPYIVATSEGDELHVTWKAPHFLGIDPGNSHVKQFANYWYSANFPDYGVELDYDQQPDRHFLAPDGTFHH